MASENHNASHYKQYMVFILRNISLIRTQQVYIYYISRYQRIDIYNWDTQSSNIKMPDFFIQENKHLQLRYLIF